MHFTPCNMYTQLAHVHSLQRQTSDPYLLKTGARFSLFFFFVPTKGWFFRNTQGHKTKFQDIQGYSRTDFTFQDILGFPGPARTLKKTTPVGSSLSPCDQENISECLFHFIYFLDYLATYVIEQCHDHPLSHSSNPNPHPHPHPHPNPYCWLSETATV